MNSRRFSPEVKKSIARSRSEAIRLGHDYIGTEHLLLGVVQEQNSLAIKVLSGMLPDLSEFRKSVENAISKSPSAGEALKMGELPLNRMAERVLKLTFLEAQSFGLRRDQPRTSTAVFAQARGLSPRGGSSTATISTTTPIQEGSRVRGHGGRGLCRALRRERRRQRETYEDDDTGERRLRTRVNSADSAEPGSLKPPCSTTTVAT